AHSRAREAEASLGAIANKVEKVVAATGKVPPTHAGPTPQPACCDQGGTCSPDDKTWDAPGWRELDFSIDGEYRYTYEYAPDPGGAFAIVRAVGDVDCDGKSGVYEWKLVVKGTTVERTESRQDPYE